MHVRQEMRPTNKIDTHLFDNWVIVAASSSLSKNIIPSPERVADLWLKLVSSFFIGQGLPWRLFPSVEEYFIYSYTSLFLSPTGTRNKWSDHEMSC